MVEQITNNLKALRARSGLTKAEVARRAGIKFNQLSKLETGERSLKATYLTRLASVFGVSMDEILTNTQATVCVGIISKDGGINLFVSMEALNKAMRGEPIPPDGLQGVPTPPDAYDRALALRARSTALSPFTNHEVYYYFVAELRPADTLVGEVGIVFPIVEDDEEDPRPRVRRIFRGREYGKYDLMTLENEIESNVPVRGVCRITWTNIKDADDDED